MTITVSTGLGKAIVPDVKGTELAGAAEGRSRTPDSSGRDRSEHPRTRVKKGTVIGTVPPAGTQLERERDGDAPGLERPQAGPGAVGGRPRAGRRRHPDPRRGADPGLRAARTPTQPEGQVIAQDPAAGAACSRHTTVTVVVSTGLGDGDRAERGRASRRTQARADLKAAGLSARVVKQTTNDPNEDGQVLDQSPSAGTRLPRGRGGDDLRRQVQGAADHDHHRPPTSTTQHHPGGCGSRCSAAGARASTRSRCESGASVADGPAGRGPRGDPGPARARRALDPRRRARSSCAPGAACSTPRSPSRSCTARSARTGRCRACSSAWTSPTSAPACSRRRSRSTS